MKDFLSLLVEFKDLIYPVLIFLTRSLTAFIIALGFVYIFGRMLGIVNSYRGRNLIALIITITTITLQELFIYEHSENIPDIIMSIILYCAISIIIFTLIGQKLYDRINSWLDKKIAPIQSNKTAPKKKSKTKTGTTKIKEKTKV